uniref:Uncharacterized protein n=1 Tax=Pipistrellus kuhlii TaxID=59472 RepID=A0A7J7YX94_PIPKU|nr:hypothetical protein mPipKuh1_009834 [Pipistrellus kuhlii]
MPVLLFPRGDVWEWPLGQGFLVIGNPEPAAPGLWGGHGVASAPLGGLWMRPFVCMERSSPVGAAVAVITQGPLHRCDCRAGSSPSDIGVWCEMTPFSMCSCDQGCFCQPSTKLRAGEQGTLGGRLGWPGHRGWPGRQAARTFQGSLAAPGRHPRALGTSAFLTRLPWVACDTSGL